MSSNQPEAIYQYMCPNCGGDITASRLSRGLVCSKCLKEPREEEDLVSMLKRLDKLINLKEILDLGEELWKITKFFKEINRITPWGPQRSWLMKYALRESFAMVAPTGLGKTTTGIFISVYEVLYKNGRSLIIVPTRTLIDQIISRIVNIKNELMPWTPKEDIYKLKESKIAVITSKYLRLHKDFITSWSPSLIYIDDADSLLKSRRNLYILFSIMGINDDQISACVKAYMEKNWELINKIKRNLKTTLVFSSSSLSSKEAVLIKAVLGFTPGKPNFLYRNIIDAYIKPGKDVITQIVDLVKDLGHGGLIFVPTDQGQEMMKRIRDAINVYSRAEVIYGNKTKVLKSFENGEIDVLIGSASYYGLLARGIDIPWRIRYTIFSGVPKHVFSFNDVLHPLSLIRILSAIYRINKSKEVLKVLYELRRRVNRLSSTSLKILYNDMKKGGDVPTEVKRANDLVKEYIGNEEMRKKISIHSNILIKSDRIIIPEPITYLQASGRSSRLYFKGLTTGLSIIIIDSEDLFEIFMRRLKFLVSNINWVEYQRLNITEIINKINQEREEIMKAKGGEQIQNQIKNVLFIVESPTKAKTIANFFSKPSIINQRGITIYETTTGDKIIDIVATMGHLFDVTLDEKKSEYTQRNLHGIIISDDNNKKNYIPVYSILKKCNKCNYTFASSSNICPICKSNDIQSKDNIIELLRKLALQADEVVIGTDPDTEGEKIAWDIYNSIRLYNRRIKRADFHEVTLKEILKSLSLPREIGIPLVKAQIVRRIEDRWIGFSLSQKLWKDFWIKYCKEIYKDCKKEENRNLSAGRVQTPVLGWIISRYEEYKSKKRKYYLIEIENTSLDKLYIPKEMLSEKEEVVKIRKMDSVVKEIEPQPPYTTDLFLKDSSQLLNLSVEESMRIAQDLFELGLITYHRTDSTRISDQGVEIARQYYKMIFENFEEFFTPRTWGMGGAHEAIRPTRPIDAETLLDLIRSNELQVYGRFDQKHLKVYELIFNRFMASQGNKAKVEFERIRVDFRNFSKEVEVPVKIISEGFLKFYNPFKRIYSEVKEGEYKLKKVKEILKSDVALYSQGDLVYEMKVKKIGRPSTYSKIIGTIIKRGYVKESKFIKKLVPTKLGSQVYMYLTEKFGTLVSEERTRRLEEDMDLIERGEKEYTSVIDELYEELTKMIGERN